MDLPQKYPRLNPKVDLNRNITLQAVPKRQAKDEGLELNIYDWSDIWSACFKQLVSYRDRLIQFKIVHRAYFNPSHLHKMDLNISHNCWRCSLPFLDLACNSSVLGNDGSNDFYRHGIAFSPLPHVYACWALLRNWLPQWLTECCWGCSF